MTKLKREITPIKIKRIKTMKNKLKIITQHQTNKIFIKMLRKKI
jgi:hypothetical protein